jgi:hypothetical protein
VDYKLAARIGDMTTCEHPYMLGICMPMKYVDVVINSRTPIRLGDSVLPWGDVIFEGAAMVRAGGLPLAGVLHKLNDKGRILQGSPDVLVGGPTFTVPAGITIGGDGEFKNKVIRDLFMLSTTEAGRDVFDRIGKKGFSVNILPAKTPPDSKDHPDNTVSNTGAGTVGPDGKPGEGSGSTVFYDPDAPFCSKDAKGNEVAGPPQVALQHELAHSANFAEGTTTPENQRDPASVGGAEKENETQAIGTGSHATDRGTENQLRKELSNDPQGQGDYGNRATHDLVQPAKGPWGKDSVCTAPPNLRPGKY